MITLAYPVRTFLIKPCLPGLKKSLKIPLLMTSKQYLWHLRRLQGPPGEIYVFFKNKQLLTTFLSVILVTQGFNQALADPNELPDLNLV